MQFWSLKSGTFFCFSFLVSWWVLTRLPCALAFGIWVYAVDLDLCLACTERGDFCDQDLVFVFICSYRWFSLFIISRLGNRALCLNCITRLGDLIHWFYCFLSGDPWSIYICMLNWILYYYLLIRTFFLLHIVLFRNWIFLFSKTIWFDLVISCEFFYFLSDDWSFHPGPIFSKVLAFLSVWCVHVSAVEWFLCDLVNVLISFFVRKKSNEVSNMHWELLFTFSAYEEVLFSYLSATRHVILWSCITLFWYL